MLDVCNQESKYEIGNHLEGNGVPCGQSFRTSMVWGTWHLSGNLETVYQEIWKKEMTVADWISGYVLISFFVMIVCLVHASEGGTDLDSNGVAIGDVLFGVGVCFASPWLIALLVVGGMGWLVAHICRIKLGGKK